MALASSYAADCTSDRGRNVALGWFHGSMFFGLAAGPMLGGYIGMSGGKSRPMLIFYFALVSTIPISPRSHLIIFLGDASRRYRIPVDLRTGELVL